MVDYGNKYDRMYVAIVTPYKDGTYDPDEKQLREFIKYFMQPKFVDAGIGMIINPEAGEVFYMNRDEKLKNIAIAMEEVNGKVPLFTGVSCPTTAGTVQDAIDAKKAGVDGVFVMPPMGALDVTTAWNALEYPEVWLDLLKAIQDGIGDMPIICHPTCNPHIRWGEGLPVEVAIKTCEEIETVVGWKMTYNYTGFRIVSRALRKLDRHVAILGAPAINFHEHLASNVFDGTVTGSWNYAPEPMLDHILAWRREDLREARRIWDSGLAQIQEYVYSDFSRLHIRYKTATWVRGFISNPFMRPPMPKPRKAEVKEFVELFKFAGLSVIDDDKIKKVVDSLPR